MKTSGTFNTGRGYSSEGQVINYTVHSAGVCPLLDTPVYSIKFEDTSRSITGTCENVDEFEIIHDVVGAIMSRYDSNRYI